MQERRLYAVFLLWLLSEIYRIKTQRNPVEVIQVIDSLLKPKTDIVYNVDQKMSEVVIYQIENRLVGGFYRSHSAKSNRENLNSSGMEFKTICPHNDKYSDDCKHEDIGVFDVYRILARIAGIAAHREIIQLEASK